MTAADYAVHRGVSDSYVRRLRRRGALILAADGQIDVAASDAQLAAGLHPLQGGDRRAALAGQEASPAVPLASVPLQGGPSVHEAVRRERLARARLAELELGEESKQLTRTRDVDRAMFTLVRQALERLRSIPSRVRTQVAASTDPRECEAILDEEVRKVCADMQAAGSALLLEHASDQPDQAAA